MAAATRRKTRATAKKPKAKAGGKKPVTPARKPAPRKKAAAPKKATTARGAARTTKAAPETKRTRGARATTAAKKAAPTAKRAQTGVPPTERSPSSVGLERPPAPSPSGQILAARAELPRERSLSDEEREVMAKVSETARRFVGAEGSPSTIVAVIARFVDEVRLGRRAAPESQDIRLGLGVLWGEQLRAEVGWCWVHLTYPDGFASFAVVPDDRGFACFPLNRVPDALGRASSNTSAQVFESIREGSVPRTRPNNYLVIG